MTPASDRDGLAEYRRRRRFDETPEPAGGPEPAGRPEPAAGARGPASESVAAETRSGAPAPDRAAAAHHGELRYVVHEHHARRIHWDLRLEHDGALASWAIPNGIPLDPHHNRKAVHVEDHPLEYLDFHGTIPAGSYGAGEIAVWDSGTFTVEKWREREVIVEFHGERLRGRYALFQAGSDPRDWIIHRMDPPADPSAQEMPAFLKPMLTKRAPLPEDESPWAFEVQWGGERALARSEPGRFHLLTAAGEDAIDLYPELRGLNRALGSRPAMLDGEVVVLDASGRPDAAALKRRGEQRGAAAVRRASAAVPVTYTAFDVLWLDGHPLLELPYSERSDRLASLKLEDERWRTPENFPAGSGAALLAAARAQGLRAITAKRLASPYAPGRRNGDWLSIAVPRSR